MSTNGTLLDTEPTLLFHIEAHSRGAVSAGIEMASKGPLAPFQCAFSGGLHESNPGCYLISGKPPAAGLAKTAELFPSYQECCKFSDGLMAKLRNS